MITHNKNIKKNKSQNNNKIVKYRKEKKKICNSILKKLKNRTWTINQMIMMNKYNKISTIIYKLETLFNNMNNNCRRFNLKLINQSLTINKKIKNWKD